MNRADACARMERYDRILADELAAVGLIHRYGHSGFDWTGSGMFDVHKIYRAITPAHPWIKWQVARFTSETPSLEEAHRYDGRFNLSYDGFMIAVDDERYFSQIETFVRSYRKRMNEAVIILPRSTPRGKSFFNWQDLVLASKKV